MSRDSKQDVFVFNGKILECDSMFSIKSGTTNDEWHKILHETVDFYCLMKAAQDASPGRIEKNDTRMLRRLKRTLEFARKIDPAAMAQFDIDALSKQQADQLKEGWEGYRRTIRIAQGKHRDQNADVYISNL